MDSILTAKFGKYLRKAILGERIHRTWLNSGSVTTSLKQENGKHQVFVSIMIAMTHIPNPDNCRFVKHTDGNKLNNCVSNSTWCD